MWAVFIVFLLHINDKGLKLMFGKDRLPQSKLPLPSDAEQRPRPRREGPSSPTAPPMPCAQIHQLVF